MKMSEEDKRKMKKLEKAMEDALLSLNIKKEEKILEEMLKIKSKYEKK